MAGQGQYRVTESAEWAAHMADLGEEEELFGEASGSEVEPALPVDGSRRGSGDREDLPRLPTARTLEDSDRPVTTAPGSSGLEGLVPLYEIRMVFPLCSDDSGEGYHRLALMLSDRSLVGAVPVKTDQDGASLLLAVPLASLNTESQPLAPCGRAATAPLTCTSAEGRPCQGSAFFCVWDAAHLSSGLLFDADAAVDFDIAGFGRRGDAWPTAASTLQQAEKLGFGASGERWESCAEGPPTPAPKKGRRGPGRSGTPPGSDSHRKGAEPQRLLPQPRARWGAWWPGSRSSRQTVGRHRPSSRRP